MEIFNIGIGEIIFILLIALVLLGPEEMTKAARNLGRFLRQIIRSPMWNDVVTTSRQIRELPIKIIREANLEEGLKEARQASHEINREMNDAAREARQSLFQANDAPSIEKTITTPPVEIDQPSSTPETPGTPDDSASNHSV